MKFLSKLFSKFIKEKEPETFKFKIIVEYYCDPWVDHKGETQPGEWRGANAYEIKTNVGTPIPELEQTATEELVDDKHRIMWMGHEKDYEEGLRKTGCVTFSSVYKNLGKAGR